MVWSAESFWLLEQKVKETLGKILVAFMIDEINSRSNDRWRSGCWDSEKNIVYLISSMTSAMENFVAIFLINSILKKTILLCCGFINVNGKFLGAKLDLNQLQPSLTVKSEIFLVVFDPCQMVKLVCNTFAEKMKMTDYIRIFNFWNRFQNKLVIDYCRNLGLSQFKGSKGTVEFMRLLYDTFDER